MAVIQGAPVPVEVLADPQSAYDAFERYLLRTGLSDATKRAYLSQTRGYLGWLAQQDKHRTDELFTDPYTRDYAVRDYKRHLMGDLARKPKSVDDALTAIGVMYRWTGLGTPNVTRAHGIRREMPKSLEQDEVRSVLRAGERRGPRDHALISLVLGCGLRRAEVTALNVDDVWLTDRRGEVNVRLGKGDKQRTVAIPGLARVPLGRWLADRTTWKGADGKALFLSRAGERMSERTIHHTVSTIGDQAGVKLSPHVLRHTFARLLVSEGVDIVTVSELMGHASVDTTRIYSLPTREEKHAAVERSLNIDY